MGWGGTRGALGTLGPWATDPGGRSIVLCCIESRSRSTGACASSAAVMSCKLGRSGRAGERESEEIL